MDMRSNVSLQAYSTMRLGGTARFLLEATDRQSVVNAVEWATAQNLPVIMIGGGSNIFWQDSGFDGLVIVNKIGGYQDVIEDADNHYLTVGAGENWDGVVARSVAAGLTGIECLSLVPGSAGGTPVQNVGAYGQEIADSLVSVEAYDRQAHGLVTIAAADCGFGYRTSRFKTVDKGRFFITALTLHLLAANPQPPFYAGLQHYLDQHGMTDYTPAAVRDAVVAIRRAKLPDPALIANNGSFFANPVISSEAYRQLAADHDGLAIPHWDTADGQVKIAAAWLIEQAGFKGVHDQATGMATWSTQPLVLVNEHARTTADLLAFKQKIVAGVQQRFSITLQQEPELLP